jgi:peptidoglycan/xylan/chitin deacetylase (PgdA/CDA1 family)
LVLAYHGFGNRSAEQDPHNLFVTVDALTDHIDRLLSNGWRALSLPAYLAGLARRVWPRRSFFVTIDDGYVSTLVHAAPIFASRRVPATVFVPAALVGKTSGWMGEMPHEQLLDDGQLRELARYGIDVGAHGMEHSDMTCMDTAGLRRNTVVAREALADLVGTPPRVFAYPFGAFDAAAAGAVRRSGYEAGFALGLGRGRFALTRVAIDATDNRRSFWLKQRSWWPVAESFGHAAPGLRRGLHRMVGSER